MLLIKIKDLYFYHGNIAILKGINIDINFGKITAIMGPSGTGKTTLLRLIGGQLNPDHGTIEINGQNINKLSQRKLYELRRRMGMLFQSSALLTDLSAYDNVAFPLREHTNLPESMIRDLVIMKLQAVGLRCARNLMPHEMSCGMKRRVALARAIVLDPMMIMYDEPFTGQDPVSLGILVNLIKRINKAMRLTSIVVSHDLHETVKIADHIYLLSKGTIIAQGSPLELKNSSSKWVQQFMQGLPDGPVPFHYPGINFKQDILNSEI